MASLLVLWTLLNALLIGEKTLILGLHVTHVGISVKSLLPERYDVLDLDLPVPPVSKKGVVADDDRTLVLAQVYDSHKLAEIFSHCTQHKQRDPEKSWTSRSTHHGTVV